MLAHGYTPVKGTDYFTEEEIQQIQNEVSGGAIGDFKAVVDEETATFSTNAENTLTDYNANAQEKFDTYNANAESKLGAYDNNAQAKLDLYNQNDSEKTEAYNSNAQTKLAAYNENADERVSELNTQTEQIQNELKILATETAKFDVNAKKKLEDYDSNAEAKLIEYNSNDSQKTSAYNQNALDKLNAYNTNAESKLAEYNANAETKTAEFDSNAALQTEVDRLRGECDTLAAEKANIDGYYEEMTVGDAEQLIATQFVEDNEPYLFRPTGGSSDVGNRAYLDKIVGGTVAWNQIFKNTRTYSFGVTITNNSDGSMTLNGTTAKLYFNIDPISSENFTGHKYMLVLNIIDNPDNVEFSYEHLNQISAHTPAATKGIQRVIYSQDTTHGTSRGFSGFSNGTVFNDVRVCVMEYDLTQMFGSTIADYIYSIEQSQKGAGVAWFKKLFPKDYYPYNAGELLSVEGLQSHDTVGFNQWDEEWEAGAISGGSPSASSSTIRSKNFCYCLPSTTYYGKCGDYTNEYYMVIWWYDENKQYISNNWVCGTVVTSPSNARYFKLSTNTSTYTYGSTYNHDICINLSDPSRNGEYEPYEKHSYPLDSSLTLRGIPKLDASNNIYYDGDEYTSDGKVKRKYVVVDLGTLNYTYITSDNIPRFRATPSGLKEGCQVVSSMYVYTGQSFSTLTSDKTVSNFGPASNRLEFRNDSYTDATAFKAAMSGVMLVYELATPTTETAEPFQHIQIVDDFGTEEFVSTGIVPVGHMTRYPANLRDKLQHLPSLASADGTYLIQQLGKQMSLIRMPAVFPDTPTEDGTYTLKTVVTGGVATLQWVVE